MQGVAQKRFGDSLCRGAFQARAGQRFPPARARIRRRPRQDRRARRILLSAAGEKSAPASTRCEHRSSSSGWPVRGLLRAPGKSSLCRPRRKRCSNRYPSSCAPCADANCLACSSASARGTLNSTEASGKAWKKYLYATPAPSRPARIQIRRTPLVLPVEPLWRQTRLPRSKSWTLVLIPREKPPPLKRRATPDLPACATAVARVFRPGFFRPDRETLSRNQSGPNYVTQARPVIHLFLCAGRLQASARACVR